MSRVKQISVDVLVKDDVDGEVAAKLVAEILEQNMFIVLGSQFQEDLTETYTKSYPDLIKSSN